MDYIITLSEFINARYSREYKYTVYGETMEHAKRRLVNRMRRGCRKGYLTIRAEKNQEVMRIHDHETGDHYLYMITSIERGGELQ